MITYNAMISTCEKARQPIVAWKLFEALQRHAALPDVITYNAMISA